MKDNNIDMNIVAIIPARMGSSRFPGKPLEKILGIPMIGHVYNRCKMAKTINEVYIATCDQEIENYIHSIGGEAVMTSSKHERASDRTAEALLIIEKQTGRKINIVVMLQGDEPMIVPEMIDAAVKPLIEDSNIKVSNLMAKLKSQNEHEDPNEVKVVVDKNNFALYFSREPIPSRKIYSKEILAYKQVCIIPFTRDSLLDYSNLDATPLEIIESVDMNRFLENGIKVKMVPTTYQTYAVDTLQDLTLVEEFMTNDILLNQYIYNSK
jgi:3-deoxy-manno-octulosonate cytidylyltransferase (CMP-KDO synthetase)